MPSEEAIRNRDLLLNHFMNPHILRDAVNIVGSELVTGNHQWRQRAHDSFALAFPSYHAIMCDMFDRLRLADEQALIQLTTEILNAEKDYDGQGIPVLFQYIPN